MQAPRHVFDSYLITNAGVVGGGTPTYYQSTDAFMRIVWDDRNHILRIKFDFLVTL
jgi:hypothetical protein